MAMKIKIPNVTLNSGNQMPMIGLGTSKCENEDIKRAVKHAIKCGYRHFDSAWSYTTQTGVASALGESIAEGLVTRKDLFLTHKVNCDSEWPFTDVDYVETWKAFIELQKDGLVRDIGISNFNEYQMNRILQETSVIPAVNQIENHPYMIQEKLVAFCQKNSITVTAHTPLASFGGYIYKALDHVVLADPKLKEIALKWKKSPAQIALRFQIQRNIAVIPKSVTPSRIEENAQIFDFELSEEEMNIIAGLNINYRVADWNVSSCFNYHDISKHKYYPFRENYSE